MPKRSTVDRMNPDLTPIVRGLEHLAAAQHKGGTGLLLLCYKCRVLNDLAW